MFEEVIESLFLIVKIRNHLIVRILIKYVIVYLHDITPLKIRFLKNGMKKKPFDIISKKFKYKITYTPSY